MMLFILALFALTIIIKQTQTEQVNELEDELLHKIAILQDKIQHLNNEIEEISNDLGNVQFHIAMER